MPPILLTIDEQYTYDSNGNRLSTTGARQSDLGSHNRLQTDGTFNYVYDNEGNTIRRTQISDGSVLEYQWDHRNRLTNISTKAAGATVSSRDIFYYYDAFDRRVGKTIDYEGNGVIDRSWVYVFDGQNTVMVLQDADGAGSMQGYRISERISQGPAVDMVMSEETYIGGAGPLVGSSIASSNSGTTLWTIGDDQGSIQDAVDNNGVVRRRVSYNAFGQRTNQIDTDANCQVLPAGSTAALDTLFGYTGRDWDSDAQLQNNRARWYDPTTARWLSQDPISFVGGDSNLYRYVGNNPTMATDPSGLLEPIAPPTPEEMERIRRELYRHRAMGGIVLGAHGNGRPAGSYAQDPNNRTISASAMMSELGIRKNTYVWGFPVETQDYITFKQGCMGLNKLRLNSEKEVFYMDGTRAFSTLKAALDAQREMMGSYGDKTRIVISAYQDKFLDEQLTPFLLPGSESEYDVNQNLRFGPPNTQTKGNLAVFDFITVHQNDDRSVCFYETMDFGYSQNSRLDVKRKTNLYPSERAGTIYLVTPIPDHPRAPRSPSGTKRD